MGSPGLWVAFNLCVLAMLAVDLFVFNRGAHEISLRTAAVWSAVWVLLSLGFAAWILRAHGRTPALEFLTGYLIEKSLSIDNLFVFLVVFRGLGIERKFQHRVLFWGVLGALLLRGSLIALGAALLQRFSWILYLFGAFLVLVGLQLLIRGNRGFRPERNPVLAWARRVFPVSGTAQEARFFIFENGRRAVTHLFLALLVIEFADVLFALDSVPAVWDYARSVSCVLFQCVRDSGFARVLFFAGWSAASVSLSGRRSVCSIDFYRSQDARGAVDSCAHFVFSSGGRRSIGHGADGVAGISARA